MSEDNLMRIMNEVSYLGARTDAYNVFALDDPEITQYPIIYLTEAGWWTLTDREVAAFRAYLLKGGFAIFDDFKLAGRVRIRRRRLGYVRGEHEARAALRANSSTSNPRIPIFHSFFEINSLQDFPQAYNSGQPIFRGLYEDNDPHKRLLMVVNYNTDISQYWEWSAAGCVRSTKRTRRTSSASTTSSTG